MSHQRNKTGFKFDDDFKDLILKMLEYNPINRLNFEEIKNHPWYKNFDIAKEEVVREMKKRVDIMKN